MPPWQSGITLSAANPQTFRSVSTAVYHIQQIMKPAEESSSPPTYNVHITESKAQENSWADNFSNWRKKHISDFTFLISLSLIVGVLAGAAAYIFKIAIHYISSLFIPHIQDHTVNWWILLIPVGGILITGIFTRYIIHTNLTHGVSQLMRDLKHHTYRLRGNLMYSSVVGGSFTLGMGGSSGAEGPIAYTGAAIGSNVAQLFRLPPEMIKALIGCGASAGIAGIFSAPIGGLMFAIELLHIKMSVREILAATVASLAAYLTMFTCKGFHPDLTFIPLSGFDPDLIPTVVCLGIFCGLYCTYYSFVTSRMDTFFKRISNPWRRNITGGLILGIIILIFPSMFSVGYPVIGNIINGDCSALAKGSILEHMANPATLLPLCAAGILLFKCFAVASTNCSGGVGGDFAPTLFAGSMAGFLFASLCNNILGLDLPVGIFAYLGMAGVMAGVIEAPLMTIFITMEMTQSYRFALPLVVCATTSFITVKCIAKLAGIRHPLVIHNRWFTHGHPEPTPNSKE